MTSGAASDSSAAAADTYLRAIRREAVRVLGLMDREPLSPTRGCMDRTHWSWKFTDFPGARFQEGLCFLSFLHATEFEGNAYFRNPNLASWIAAGFDYWTSIQYRGGDFDEAYPFEHSLAATAFTTFYLGEAWELVQDHLPPQTIERFKRATHRAGVWLENNDETHGFLSNHLAAAAAALYHVYRITGQERFDKRSRYFLDRILEHQSSEGWYDEYGSADPGYQTHGSFYLARYLQLSNDSRLEGSLDESFKFLAHFVHPDGSLGGEYASRNTQFYYPAAFEMLSGTSGAARWIAEEMQSSVSNLAAAGLGSMDAYNYFPLLNNYVFAYRACVAERHRSAAAQGPGESTGLVYFPKAGLLKKRTARYDLFVGLSKCGVIKAFDRKRGCLVHNDCGYLGRLRKGGLLSSQTQVEGRQVQVADDEVAVSGKFFGFKKPVMKPTSFLGFRLFSLTFGRVGWIGYWLKSLLVKVLIYRRNELDLTLDRRISMREDGFTVRDRIQGDRAGRVESLRWVPVFTTIHMGSSKYFVPGELNGAPSEGQPLDVAGLGKGLTLERSISFD